MILVGLCAVKEDNCTGRFWEGRFKSQAVLDEGALLNDTEDGSIKCSNDLVKFIGNENKSKRAEGVCFSQTDYFELVDWTGRVVREDKRGAIPDNVLPILEKLKLNPELWLSNATEFSRPYQRSRRGLIRAA